MTSLRAVYMGDIPRFLSLHKSVLALRARLASFPAIELRARETGLYEFSNTLDSIETCRKTAILYFSGVYFFWLSKPFMEWEMSQINAPLSLTQFLVKIWGYIIILLLSSVFYLNIWFSKRLVGYVVKPYNTYPCCVSLYRSVHARTFSAIELRAQQWYTG